MAGDFRGRSTNVVERWILEADQYRAELKQLSREIRASNKAARDADLVQREMGRSLGRVEEAADKTATKTEELTKHNRDLVRTFADIKAVADTAAIAFRKLAAVADEALTTGQQYAQMQRTATIGIEAAAKASRGLVDDMTLLKAANRAATYQLNLTDKAFAKLARGAVILGQRTGIDAAEAFERLIQGMGKMEQEILDELGIVARAEDAFSKYAKEIGVAKDQMTQAQKRTAFMTYVTEQVAEKTRGATVDVRGAGGAWAQLKTEIENASLAIKGWIASHEGTGIRFRMYADGLRTVGDLWSALGGKIDIATASSSRFQRSVVTMMSFVSGAGLDEDFNKVLGHLNRVVGAQKADRSDQASKAAAARKDQQARSLESMMSKQIQANVDKKGKRKGRRRSFTGALPARPGEMDTAMVDQLIRDRRDQAAADRRYREGIDQVNIAAGMGAARAEKARQEAALRVAADVQRQLEEFQSNLTGESEGFSLLERMLPDREFERVARGMQDLVARSEDAGNAIMHMANAASGAYEAAGSALFDLVSTEKSAKDAFRDAFHNWLSMWGKRMSFKAMESAGEALLLAAMGNWPGAAKAGAAAVAFGAAAVAAGLGAKATAPSTKKAPAQARGVDRGVGGPASSSANRGGSATFVYNINTITPPDEDAAATFVASSVNRARAMGLAV